MVPTGRLTATSIKDRIINDPLYHGEMEARSQTIKVQAVVAYTPHGAPTGYLYCIHMLR